MHPNVKFTSHDGAKIHEVSPKASPTADIYKMVRVKATHEVSRMLIPKCINFKIKTGLLIILCIRW